MKINKAYLFLILVIVIGVCLYLFINQKKTPQESRDYPQIEKEGTLRFVTDYNSIGYYVSGDTIQGFNYDLIQLLKSYTSLDLEILLESNFNKSISGLNQGQYDVLVRNIPITSELKDSLIFTIPVAQNKQVLVQRKEIYNDGIKPIRSQLDLAKQTIYVSEDSPAILRVNNLSREIGDTIYIVEDSLYNNEQLIMKVASKEIDYAVCDEKIAKRMAQSLPEIDYKTFVGFTHLEAWAVRKDSPVLLDSLNRWLDSVMVTQDYKAIYQKYYK